MCWAYDTVPSNLGAVLWSNSLEDLKLKAKLKFGLVYVKSIQEFCHLAKAASMVFGSGEGESSPPKDVHSAQLQFAAVLGGL